MRKTLIASLLLACCSVATPALADDDYIKDGPERVKAADWKKMETVTITLEEFHFTPHEIKLKADQPYKVELKNIGEKDHYFTAPEFFRAVAWRKLMVAKNAEIKVPYPKDLEVLKKGGQLDLFIIPVKKGTYNVICTIDDHKDKGMEGKVIIE